jgi:tRNA (mo5U34)-methyltransferase
MVPQESPLREKRRKQNDFSADLAQKGWYHSFELPDGTAIQGVMQLDWQRKRWERYPIPPDLTGKRVLDIGAWDGWFSFEAERRGAEVTSVDCVEIPNYLHIHRTLASKAVYRNLDLYELPAAELGKFDIVLCLGVLYHVKHPFLALEIVCSLATDVAIVETFVTDGETWRDHQGEIPALEFYETDELNGQMDNWFGPSVGSVLAMCRAVGFARVELVGVDTINAAVACHRRWEPEPAEPGMEPPELLAVVNATTSGRNIYSQRDDYLTCWFRTPAESVTLKDLRLEVGGFGAPAVYLRREEHGGYTANFRVPPGSAAGWNQVRLRLANSRFSGVLRIAVDMPVVVERIAVHNVCDSATWQSGEVRVTEGAHASCWVEGLPENCDFHNIRLWLGDTRLPITWVGEPDEQGLRQINAAISRDCAMGEHPFRVECGGVASAPIQLTLISG